MKAALIVLSRTDIKDYAFYINQVIDNAQSLGALSGFAATQDIFLANVLSACGVPICDIATNDKTIVSCDE